MTLLDPELAIAAGRVDQLIARVREAGSIAARRFALDALARGLLAADPGSVDARARADALALRVDPSTVAAADTERLPHAVAVPLVAARHELGFVRQMYVTFDPVGLRAGDDLYDLETRRCIEDAIEAAARIAPPPSDPLLHRLVAAQPRALRHARVEGRSLSAAAFVSAMSLWTGRGVREGVAVTGELRGPSVVAVGAVDVKVRAALAHGLRTLVVPLADEAHARACLPDGATLEVLGVASQAALLDATLEPDGHARLEPERAADDARRVYATGWRGYRWPSVRERLARISGALPSYRFDLRVDVMARQAAAERHLGDPAGSLELLREAESLARSSEGAVPDAPLTYLYQQMAMTCRQLCRFGEATRAAERAVRIARRGRLRGELIKALGCLGLVSLSRARVPRAIESFSESLAVMLEHEPHRTARTRAYLIEAHGARGQSDEAARQFRAAMDELERAPDEADRRERESWVRTSWGGTLLRLGLAGEAKDMLDVDAVRVSLADEPLPGLLARRHLGIALTRAGERERGFELLAASPLAHGRALEPHLAFAAHLNVLFEAQARVAAGAWGRDIAGRALRALEHVPRYDRVSAFLERPLVASQAWIERGAPPSRASALDALLERCARLG